MSGGMGEIAWVAMMAALVLAYLVGMRRNDGLRVNQIIRMALIWVAIIGGAYFVVSWITGLQ